MKFCQNHSFYLRSTVLHFSTVLPRSVEPFYQNLAKLSGGGRILPLIYPAKNGPKQMKFDFFRISFFSKSLNHNTVALVLRSEAHVRAHVKFGSKFPEIGEIVFIVS